MTAWPRTACSRLRAGVRIVALAGLAPLVACNQVFGVQQTQLFDAPPPDAPFRCPEVGAPEFTGFAIEEIRQTCDDYMTNSRVGLAIGRCDVQTAAGLARVVAMGPLGSPLDFIPSFDPRNYYRTPRLSPDGERLYVGRGNNPAIERYRRSGTTWTLETEIPIPFGTLSTIAEGSGRDVMLVADSATDLREWEIDASSGTARELLPAHGLASELGVTSAEAINLSSDGLRLVFNGVPDGEANKRVMFASRASPGSPFGKAELVAGVPRGDSPPFMTEDCSRVYVAGLGRVFYVPRR